MKKVKLEWKLETKKKVILISSIILVVLLIMGIGFYIGNEVFRTFVDRYIFRKEIQENNAASITIGTGENPSIYVYDKYITILNKNKLISYTSSGEKKYEHEININDALYNSNNRFLGIAQKNGKNIYLISEANILWQNEIDIEGSITKINVNKNGYVSVIITGSSYKTVIITYNPEGKELFKTYLSTTTAIDTDISSDNKYLSIAEIDTTGTLIQSDIKIISMEKAKNDPTNSVIYIYKANANDLITDIQYQDKKLVCMYDTGIHILENEQDTTITDFSDNKIILASIEFENYSMYAVEKSAGLFTSNAQIYLKNSQTQKENIYTSKSAVKSIKTYANTIALNMGSQVDFINTNGWLIKKYISEQEIKDIIVSDKIGGIVYKDKIEIINL